MIEERHILGCYVMNCTKYHERENTGTLVFDFTGYFWLSPETMQEKIIAHLCNVILVFCYSINDLKHGSNSCATSDLLANKNIKKLNVILNFFLFKIKVAYGHNIDNQMMIWEGDQL